MHPIRGNFGNYYGQNLSNQTTIVTVEIKQTNPVVRPVLVMGLTESAQHQINDQMMLNQLHRPAPNWTPAPIRGRTVVVVTPGRNPNQPGTHISQNGYREQVGRRP